MKYKSLEIKEIYPKGAKTNVDFILQTPLLRNIEVSGKISLKPRRRRNSLVEQLTRYQTILSDSDYE